MANKIHLLPTIAVRGIVLFPYMHLNFDVGRKSSINAVREAEETDSLIFVTSQKDPGMIEAGENDIYRIGTIAKIKQVLKNNGEVVRLIVEGISRGIITDVIEENPHLVCEIREISDNDDLDSETGEAYVREIRHKLELYFSINPKLSPDKFFKLIATKRLGVLCDLAAAVIELEPEEKQKILEHTDCIERAELLLEQLERLVNVIEIEREISAKTKKALDQNQREFVLREQMRVIQDELGEKENVDDEVEEFREKVRKARMPKETSEKLLKDINRFSKLPLMSADSSVLRTYIETVLDLPWNNYKREKFNMADAEKILNDDHYGLEKVKERILEFLAVRSLTDGRNSTVLCLEGPPGVGKTSIAKSIARALGRKFIRVSLGGIHDESDIRGHRKTYIGAMEGRIMAAMREAKVKNPLILLDEIDKMGADYKGDPSAALLEVLDNEQNNAFRDHYIEVPFDLSHVMFITTANTLDTIASPLLDRMEIIRLSGYTASEKFHIARGYLMQKALDKTGMSENMLEITDGALNKIIDHYTREAGVRKLEQTLEALCRKAAKRILDTHEEKIVIDENNISDYLGKERFHFELMNERDEVGIARGLAWTSVGGDTLSIEVNVMPGTGKVELTGKLGEVMQESAKAAISYIRSRADELDINSDFYKEKDIHIHVPEGAVPKDGPSAGITMATAVVSSLTKRPVKRNIAMTGEITLRGRVLPIGGLKEKAMAAYRAGIRTIIIPEDNTPDIDDVPEEIRNELKFIPVTNMETVLNTALV